MALFELDNGRLVPAQFGREVPGGFTPDVLRAVRSQVLEIVARPLFPITWRNIHGGSAPSDLPRLTALDASGQVVAVEVVEELDADLLIDSLSRLADTAARSWVDLAREYPGDIEGFKVDWAQFRESMPPTTPNGPRLIIVAAAIEPEVRPALDVLASSGVEVHEMALRQMSNGRSFLDVSAVGPRTYGHRANLLVGDSNPVPEISGLAQKREVPAPRPRVVTDTSTRVAHEPLPARSDVVPEGSAPDVLERRVPHAPAHRSRSKSPFPSRLERRTDTGSIRIPARVDEGPEALAMVSKMVGRPTPLVLDPRFGLTVRAELGTTGLIRTAAGQFNDPTLALQAVGYGGEDGWASWHLGDVYGPTLAEAIAEINAAAR
ncbi:hypothetical protein [Scrofimicrobium sp. R131]|uniref:RAMA domain-containing protein n=1 Tax=Scrofimicrobium appendicitidis TaxID=3079930 RepID=A0AAU7V6B9_9ACTO